MNLPLFKFYLYAKFNQNKVSDISILQKKDGKFICGVQKKSKNWKLILLPNNFWIDSILL